MNEIHLKAAERSEQIPTQDKWKTAEQYERPRRAGRGTKTSKHCNVGAKRGEKQSKHIIHEH